MTNRTATFIKLIIIQIKKSFKKPKGKQNP